VERKFTIIGESLSHLSKLYPHIGGRIARLYEIIGLSNILNRANTINDLDRVWKITQKSLPELKASVRQLMAELSDTDQ
jgi:uncharacterized protein with HEPN domain